MGHPTDGIEDTSIKKENLGIIRSRRVLRFFQDLGKCRACGPDVEIRVLFISNRAN